MNLLLFLLVNLAFGMQLKAEDAELGEIASTQVKKPERTKPIFVPALDEMTHVPGLHQVPVGNFGASQSPPVAGKGPPASSKASDVHLMPVGNLGVSQIPHFFDKGSASSKASENSAATSSVSSGSVPIHAPAELQTVISNKVKSAVPIVEGTPRSKHHRSRHKHHHTRDAHREHHALKKEKTKEEEIGKQVDMSLLPPGIDAPGLPGSRPVDDAEQKQMPGISIPSEKNNAIRLAVGLGVGVMLLVGLMAFLISCSETSKLKRESIYRHIRTKKRFLKGNARSESLISTERPVSNASLLAEGRDDWLPSSKMSTMDEVGSSSPSRSSPNRPSAVDDRPLYSS